MIKCLDSLLLCGLRVTALDGLGNVATGPNNFASTNRELSLGFTADIDQGKDIFNRNGCDAALNEYKSPPLTKRLNLAFVTMGLDIALQSLMLGATLILGEDTNPYGYELPIQTCPADGTPPYVALEAWTKAENCDFQDPDTPYWYYLFPITQWVADQQVVLQDDFAQSGLSGFTRKNPLWGHGPYGGVVVGPEGGSDYLNLGGPAVIQTSTPPPDADCQLGTVTPGS